MADARLEGAEHARGLTVIAEDPVQRGQLDGIAQRGAGGVALDVADVVRLDAGHAERQLDHLGLALDTGRGVARAYPAVVVDRRAEDHRMDDVAVLDRLRHPLQGDRTDAAAHHGAVGLGVEAAHHAVRRGDAALLVQVAGRLRQRYVGATGDGDVALVGEQALAGQVHRDHGGRAEGLHADRRATQAELVGDQRGKGVPLVADRDQQRAAGLGGQVRDVLHDVVREAAAGEHADLAGHLGRAVAGRLQRFPGGFEEQPVLRVHRLRLTRVDAEHRGVEQVGVRHRATHPDVARVGQLPRIGAGGDQLLVGELAQSLDTVEDVAPQLGDAVRAREPSGHADHGNG